MRKYIIYSLLFFPFVINTSCLIAQNEAGQIVINAGVGESPGFNGDNGTGPGAFIQLVPYYPIATVLDHINISGMAFYSREHPPEFVCSSIKPNIGGAIDFGLTSNFSVGLATNYQSEIVSWTPASNSNIGTLYPCSDKITRANMAIRFLYQVKPHKNFNTYFGIRCGISYWHDMPSPDNNLTISYLNISPYFITAPDITVPSFQVLLGLRFYPIKFVGIHFEIGLGSPYLFEGGITFRINTHKTEVKGDAAIPATK